MKPERAQVLTQGLVAGFVGYAAVVAFVSLADLFSGRPIFHTAAALGTTLFYGLEDPATLVIAPGPVLAYNGIHLALSLAAGTVAAWLLFETERHHFIWYFVLFVFFAGFLFSLLAIGIVGAEIAHLVPWWSIVVANLTWAAALGGYLWYQHRGLLARLDQEQESGL
jgi:hypothetical protein